MAAATVIAWTDHTFNLVWGCTKISPGCANCYAETLSKSKRYGTPLDVWGPDKPRRTLGAAYWREPLKWDRQAKIAGERRRVFCGSMFDWCDPHPTVKQELARLWPLISQTPNLDWLLLTKRPEHIGACLPANFPRGFRNVWLGTSIENNDYAGRADMLRRHDATVRFVSYEPALGPLDRLDLTGLDWVIYGGESGPGYRDHDVQWARDLRTRCDARGVAFFFKQSPAPRTEMGIELDGEIVRAYPAQAVSTAEQGSLF